LQKDIYKLSFVIEELVALHQWLFSCYKQSEVQN